MIALFLAAALAAPAPPPAAPLTVASARQTMLGRWTGQLEYRDYQADKWFGLPLKATISDGGDGVTQLRVADFDDGPKTGNVRITTVSILDPAKSTETSASFRKDRPVTHWTATLALAPTTRAAPPPWTLIATIKGEDDNRPATLRETTVRNGATMVTLKEVDFLDDTKAEWRTRNRTTLVRAGSTLPKKR